jgi:hypothetical protein
MLSAICTVNSTSTTGGTVDVTGGATVTIALADATGANIWTVSAIYPDDTVNLATVNSSIVINQTTKTATFTAPSAGSVIFRSVINGGVDLNGNMVQAYTSQFKVSVPIASIRTLCVNETIEGSPTFGWVKGFNDVVRAEQGGGGGGGGAPSGTAGGDLSGSYPNPAVAKVTGVFVTGTPASGKTIVCTSGSAATWTTPPGGAPSGTASGDLAGVYPNPTVGQINGATIPTAGALTTGNVLKVSGAATLTYGPINLAGGTNHVSGTLPASNQQAQTLAGDLTGNTGAAVVSKINGITVTGTPTTGQTLTATSTLSATWSTGGGGGSFTAGGDLSGTSTSQSVIALTGVSGVVAFPLATPTPVLKQLDVTTAGVNGQTLTLRSQSATGSGSNGGSLVLTSGTGTTIAGSVKIQTGAVDRIVITPVSVSIVPTQILRTGNTNCRVWEDYTSTPTSNASSTVAYSFNIANNATTHLDVVITATLNSNTQGGSFKRSADFRNNSGTAAQINATQDGGSNLDAGLTWTATIDRSSTTARVLVTGAAGTTIRWGVYVSVMETYS